MRLFGRKEAPEGAPPPRTWRVLPNPPNGFSSGIPELDQLLGGGYPEGSVHLFEGDPSTNIGEFWRLFLPAIVNAGLLKQGSLIVPPVSEPPSSGIGRVSQFVPLDFIDRRVRFLHYGAAEFQGPWLVPLARLGRVDAMSAVVRAEKDVAGKPVSRHLEVVAAESYELVAKPEVALQMITVGAQRARELGNSLLVWTRSSSPNAAAIAGLSDTYLRVFRGPKGTAVSGVRPPFPGHGLTQTAWPDGSAGTTLSGL
jgi:hypothetical protein